MYWHVLARTGTYWQVLARTGTYWHWNQGDQGDFGKNEYFWTFCKSVHDGRRGGEKSNEEALWLRQERLKILLYI